MEHHLPELSGALATLMIALAIAGCRYVAHILTQHHTPLSASLAALKKGQRGMRRAVSRLSGEVRQVRQDVDRLRSEMTELRTWSREHEEQNRRQFRQDRRRIDALSERQHRRNQLEHAA